MYQKLSFAMSSFFVLARTLSKKGIRMWLIEWGFSLVVPRITIVLIVTSKSCSAGHVGENSCLSHGEHGNACIASAQRR